MSTKPPTRGKLTHDHELLVISRGFDLLATLPPGRREFVANYWFSRISDMPVLAEVVDQPQAETADPPIIKHIDSAKAKVA